MGLLYAAVSGGDQEIVQDGVPGETRLTGHARAQLHRHHVDDGQQLSAQDHERPTVRLPGLQTQQVYRPMRLAVPGVPQSNGNNQWFGIIVTKAPTTNRVRIIGRPGRDLGQHLGKTGDQHFDRATVYRASDGQWCDR